ncbi:insulinase family protein, partial [candidate division KSB1 bacterium]|nr:insulinase family protein [candidate division KSB1 bacterium]
MYLRKCFAVLCGILLFTCQPAVEPGFQVNFEKYTLDNGLDVILHIDRSDPIVAVAVTYHVGSAREIEGRTGFAHMFEHLLFQNSENLGEGGLDLLMQKVGGTTPNGSTTRDRTNYIEVFPKDALEKAMWAESDRMGFFINTVTTPNFEREKQIVKNEKRQGVDNNPYGHTNYVISKNLYPPEHPYSWQVIGSLDDLQRATVQDVKNFYEKWYGPNNATLVIAGDLEVNEVKRYVEKYFGEIKSRGTITPLSAEPVALTETKKLYHEDTFAKLPRMTMTWLAVKLYHQDYYALNALGQLLSRGKKSPFYKVLVEEKKLTSNVSVGNRGSELSGEFTVTIQGFPGTDLNDIAVGINEAFGRFETEGITEKDLSRIKTRQETGFYNSLSSVLSKATTLARFSIFAGDPGYTTTYIDNIMGVTIEDVNRVYERYIKGKHYIATSFVPRGNTDLVLDGSAKAEVVEEAIITGAEREIEYGEQEEIEITPSAIDRSVEPPLGDLPEIRVPAIWTDELSNGMKLFGIEHTEVPLVQFTIRLKGGMLLDDPEKVGVANFTASIMTEGTKNRTPEELEEVIDELGASIRLFASNQSITVSGNTLTRNYEKVMALVEEILLEPRWDEKEFELLKQRILNNIRQRSANPNVIASIVFNKLLYGKDHILSNSAIGTISSVESITMDDL